MPGTADGGAAAAGEVSSAAKGTMAGYTTCATSMLTEGCADMSAPLSCTTHAAGLHKACAASWLAAGATSGQSSWQHRSGSEALGTTAVAATSDADIPDNSMVRRTSICRKPDDMLPVTSSQAAKVICTVHVGQHEQQAVVCHTAMA
jgi:hypothetical protein